MGRTAKIAAAAALGGLLLALTIGMAATERPRTNTVTVHAGEVADYRVEPDLRRCRTLTMPDAGCEAAWEDKRRRFFGKDERP